MLYSPSLLKDLFAAKRRKELAQMRLCYDMQREVSRLRIKAHRWRDQADFYQGWRDREDNQLRLAVAKRRYVSSNLVDGSPLLPHPQD